MKNKFIYIFVLIFYTCSSYVGERSKNYFEIHNVSLIDKVSQMIMVRMDGNYHNNESWRKENIEDLIKNYNIGGLITFSGNVHGTFSNIKQIYI